MSENRTSFGIPAEALKDKDAYAGAQAISVGPNAKAAVPVLVEAYTDDDGSVRDAA